jgi:hypothetical protein
MMALPESGSTRPPIYAPWRWRQGHLRSDCERLYITSATPGRSRDTAHHAGAVHSPWAARPTGRMAGYRCACREGDPSLIGLPSRSSRRKAASRTGAKAGVLDGIRTCGLRLRREIASPGARPDGGTSAVRPGVRRVGNWGAAAKMPCVPATARASAAAATIGRRGCSAAISDHRAMPSPSHDTRSRQHTSRLPYEFP